MWRKDVDEQPTRGQATLDGLVVERTTEADWEQVKAVRLAGIAAGVDVTSHDERKLIAMWLHPDHRAAGASKALLAAVRDWARRDGVTTLTLWATRSNHAAAGLYRGAGFSETGVSKPLPSNATIMEDQLALDLR